MRYRRPIVSALVLALTPASVGAVGAAAAAANAIKNMDYRFFVAGGVCAATSHGITTPIDVVKTKMQADPEVYNQGIGQATVSILKTDGPQALLGGLGPTVVGYGIEGAAKFGIYEVLKPVFAAFLQQDNTAAAFIAASVVAGAVASLLLCPMESTRIRIVTDPAYADRGLLTGLSKLIADEGLLSTFGGIYAMLAKQVPYTMAKQVSFDIFAGLLYSLFEKNQTSLALEDVKWLVSVTAAFIASIFACIFSQPGDMILTETYKGKTGEGFWGIVGSIYDKGGLSGFFTGTTARILHVGMIITSQLVLYDIVKQLLGLPATGSH